MAVEGFGNNLWRGIGCRAGGWFVRDNNVYAGGMHRERVERRHRQERCIMDGLETLGIQQR